MDEISNNIIRIQNQINRQDVTILAVSKTQTIEKIQLAYHAGIRDFAENYLQEALEKIPQLEQLHCNWHFIGHIQSKKIKNICQIFDWVHTIDRRKIVNLFAKTCENLEKNLNICIQVSLFDEAQKSGISIADIDELVLEILQFPRLHLRGLMTILPQDLIVEEQFSAYQSLAQLKAKLNKKYHLSMDILSMGMSSDYEQAIKAGGNMIRIGQAIFGARK